MRGLSRLLYERALRPDDDEAEKLRKRVTAAALPSLVLAGAVTHAWLLLPSRFTQDTTPARFSSFLCLGIIFDLLLLYMVFVRRMPLFLIEASQLAFTVTLIVIDWGLRAVPDNNRAWPLVILCMDFLLSANARRSVQMGVLAAVALWLTVLHSEEAFRWGLLDIEGWVQPSEAQIATHIGCADPPCARGTVRSSISLIVAVAVIYADYFATRGFAEGQRRQLDVVGAAVRVSERVAELLVAYATDDARRVVADDGAALPEPLRHAYAQLLDNLDSYRVFLPDSILYGQQQQSEGDSDDGQQGAATGTRVAPGQGCSTANVALCFTDIEHSTELWDTFPQGMFEALDVHNRVMRRAYAACGGYEVKTIGDSFMVAFPTACDAVRFGLTAQQQLLRQQWPEIILTHPLCRRVALPDGEPLWGGLPVRIGLHCGEARVGCNPVTGRCDYFGTTVNVAARLESLVPVGGSVAVSDTVARLMAERLPELGSPVLHELGHRHLKGVHDTVFVWLVLPRELAGRLPHVINSFSVETATSPAQIDGSRSRSRTSRMYLGDSGAPCSPRTLGPVDMSSDSGALSELAVPPAAQVSPRSLCTTPQPRRPSLQECGATCAVARLALAEMGNVHLNHPRVVAAACLAVDKTLGTVEGVMSACITITWNASRPCADHVAACRQFLTRSLAPEWQLGAASGRVLSGSFSAGRRSFTTVIGGIIELATALAEEAAICGDYALAAGAVAEHCEAAGLAHWAQLWVAPGAVCVVVMAVMLREYQEEAEDKWVLTEPPLAKAGPGSIAGLFHKACSGGPGSEAQLEVLSRLRRDQPSSPANEDSSITSPRQALADRIGRGVVRTRHMPALWHPAPEADRPASVLPGVLTSLGSAPDLGDPLDSRSPASDFSASD